MASDRSRISSSVRTFSIGTSGSTACTASRMIDAAAIGSPVIRTSTRPCRPSGLSERLIDLRHRFAIQPERLHVADDADDGAPRLRRC